MFNQIIGLESPFVLDKIKVVLSRIDENLTSSSEWRRRVRTILRIGVTSKLIRNVVKDVSQALSH